MQFLSIVVQWELRGLLDPQVPFDQHVHHVYI